MTRINSSRDCGNSPKNRFAEQIAIALETGDDKFLGEILDTGAVWETAAGQCEGREQVLARLASRPPPARLHIDHVITHGKAGAVNGLVEAQGGESRRFCHILTFTSARCQSVGRITSFSG